MSLCYSLLMVVDVAWFVVMCWIAFGLLFAVVSVIVLLATSIGCCFVCFCVCILVLRWCCFVVWVTVIVCCVC